MVNILGVGKSKQGRRGVLKDEKIHLIKLVDEKTTDFITKGTNDIIGLQELKDIFCAIKGNPYKMDLAKGSANAKVRHWARDLCNVDKGFQVLLKDGTPQKQYIVAVELKGDRVAFWNPVIARNIINNASPKDKPVYEQRLQTLLKLPKRMSYYE